MALKDWKKVRQRGNEYIVWRNTQAGHDVVQEMGGFGLDFVADGYALYARGDSNFQLLGNLMAYPECWQSSMHEELCQCRIRGCNDMRITRTGKKTMV